jgi:very-short-patch-repair endonuclease
MATVTSQDFRADRHGRLRRAMTARRASLAAMRANVWARSLESQSGESKQSIESFGSDYPKVARPEIVSTWEKVFYRALYQARIRPIPQYDVDQYTLDFALIEGDRRLDIEVDEEMYHRAWDGDLSQRDQLRNQRLMELGWDAMRFWVYQIRDDLNCSVTRVQEWIDSSS